MTPGGAPRPLTNAAIAAVLAEIADLLDIKGESAFKVIAYRRAAESVARSPVEVAVAYRAGDPPPLAGVGKGLAERIAELSLTGEMADYQRLREEVPPTLMAMLAIPGVGPRTVGEVWRELGIATLPELEAAAKAGQLRSIKGISGKTETRIIEGIGELERRPPRRMRMGEAQALGRQVLELMETFPGVISATLAGSARRMSETVGDLDVLVETESPEQVLRALLGSAAIEPTDDGPLPTGTDRLSVRLIDGPQLDVMTMPPDMAGAYLVHFTGSAAHNVRLRHRARQMGWSLSERGLAALPQGDAGDPEVPPEAVKRGTFASESEVYGVLGLPFIDPELREDSGEIEAAEAGQLPELVSRADLRGDCHSHSHWSDGREPLELMVDSARRLGHEYLVLTDHTQSLTIANGLTPERVEQQRRVISDLNERFAREVAIGEKPPGSHDAFRLLHGCELEITTDGRLDYDDELLDRFDVVVASLHVGRRQPRAQLMARYELAMRSPHVDVITHPSGRKIAQRPDLDLDWERFYRLAAETATLLEINGSENRLDLAEHRVRAALDAGCRFTIDSDAHDRTEWQNLVWGCAIARRGWVEASHVANTLPLERFLRVIIDKPTQW